jgi:hypothetical protein
VIEETLADQYESLSLADIYAAISYYLAHRQRVDEYLSRREQQSEAALREIPPQEDWALFRQRLLERESARPKT